MQRLKQTLEEVKQMNPRGCSTATEYEEGWNRAIEQVEFYIEQNNDSWIPVKERLPEEGGFYLVSLGIPTNIDDLKVSRAWFSETTKSFSEYGKAVTAWRPLPEPYNPERKTEDACKSEELTGWKAKMLKTFCKCE